MRSEYRQQLDRYSGDEDKLLELKEQFCKWYCPMKQKENEPCVYENCGECTGIEMAICHGQICEICQVQDYLKFIRDELGGK